MDTLSPSEYGAVEEFAKGLGEVITSRLSTEKDETVRHTLFELHKIVDLHLRLAEIKFRNYEIEMESYYGKKNEEKIV